MKQIFFLNRIKYWTIDKMLLIQKPILEIRQIYLLKAVSNYSFSKYSTLLVNLAKIKNVLI